jgi:hypothetical protein
MKRLLDRTAKLTSRLLPWTQRNSLGYVLYSYRKPDGTFDYERYRQVQEAGNRKKIQNVWVLEENIAFLADYLQRTLKTPPKFGICHGTRRGKEQEWFRKYLACEVIGTEISETATSFPNTIQWDFHQVKPEWIDAVDLIYSNSFDHSYDPERCLNAWMSCVRPGGLCILEHSSLHEPRGASEMDPFGAALTLMPYLITKWGDGRYGLRQLLKAPSNREDTAHIHFLVVQRF